MTKFKPENGQCGLAGSASLPMRGGDGRTRIPHARDLARARAEQAAERVRAAGGSAIEAASAALEAAFTAAFRHELTKRRVRVLMCRGAGDVECRLRFVRLLERHPALTLDAAIWHVERMRKAEIDARDVAIRLWGRCSKPRLAMMLLDEARLMLRWVRRHDVKAWPRVRDEILQREFFEAAE